MKTIKMKNVPPSRLGAKMSKESKARMSAAMKKRFSVPGSHPLFGKKHSDEAKRRMSESHKKFYADGHPHPLLGKHHSEESKQKMSLARLGKYSGNESPNWNGGIWHHIKGYVFISSPGHPHAGKRGYVAEHRLVVETYLKRFLKGKNEPVHHLNNIKDDNRPKNLIAFANQPAHNSFEAGNPVKSEDILFDGRNYSG